MSTRPDRLGILMLGCGYASRMHSRTLRRIAGLGVDLSYASRVGARAEAQRREFGGRRAFGSYNAGLADPAVDVVIVATPTAAHRELTLRALRAGKHVIVEKPAFLRSTDVDLVRAEAERVGRRVFVAENYVYKPIGWRLRRLIRDGDLGDIRFLTINATKEQRPTGWRAEPPLSGGGALFEAGVHWISFVANLGLEIESVRALRVGPAHEHGADLSSLVIFEFAQGGVGTLAHSWELRAPLRGLRLSKIQGTAGAVTFESNGFAAYTSGRRRGVSLMAFRDPLGYQGMLRDFLEAIRTGASSYFTLDMAQRDLQLLEEAQLSMNASHVLARLPGKGESVKPQEAEI
jgi:UDP-N-acetylglucosamine 3-dehydrogenase